MHRVLEARWAAQAVFFLSVATVASVAGGVPPTRLNVIFIMADDLGWTDLGCQGSRYYESPNIDRLASQGMRLTCHHHCQNCTPTRAALLSGQVGARTGVYTVGDIDRFDWSTKPLVPVRNEQSLPLDGESLVPLLGDSKATLRRDAIFQHFPGYLGWRTTPVSVVHAGDWKLMEYLEDGRLELYNLRDDVGETKNLAMAMPAKAKELHDRLVAWRADVKAPMPEPNRPGTAGPARSARP